MPALHWGTTYIARGLDERKYLEHLPYLCDERAERNPDKCEEISSALEQIDRAKDEDG